MFNINNNDTLLSLDSIKILYKASEIDFMLVDLFNDFSQSLNLILFDTYLGDENYNYSDKINHFKWCWDKNIDNFKKEGIIFNDTQELYEYFLEHVVRFYYLLDKEDDKEEIEFSLMVLTESIFNYDKKKTNRELQIFFKVYSLLKKSINLD